MPRPHTSLVTLNSTAGRFGFVLPKKPYNYTCCRDDYKTKIPTKSHKMAETEKIRLKNRHYSKVTAVDLIKGICHGIAMTELMFKDYQYYYFFPCTVFNYES